MSNTQRHQSLQEASGGEVERLLLLLESTCDGVWDWRADTNDVYYSPRFYTMLGYAPGDFPGRYESFEALVHPDDMPEVRQVIENCLRQGEHCEAEFRARRKDGSWAWILSRGRAVEFDDQDRAVRFLGTHTDITERKKAQAELENREAILTRSEVIANYGSWERDLASDRAIWSDNAYRILGFEPGEAEPTLDPLFSRIPEEDHHVIRGLIQRARDGEEQFDVQYRIRWPDGQMRHIRSSGIIDQSGDSPVLRGIVHDVTDQVRSGQTIAEHEKLLSMVSRIARIGGWELDTATGQQRWTEETYRIHEVDPETFSPTLEDGLAFYPDENRERIAEAVKRCSDQGVPYDLELEFETAKGRRIWVRSRGEPRYESGGIKAIGGTIQDITDHRRVLDETRRSEQSFRSLYESIRDAILVADTDRVICDLNPAFTDLFGYTLEDLAGEPTRTVYASDDDHTRLGEMVRSQKPGDNAVTVVRYRDKTGRVFPGETNTFPLKDTEGEVVGYIGLIRDVSEKVRAEEELRSREKRWRGLVQSIQAGVVVHKEDGTVTTINPVACDTFGIKEKECVGATIEDTFCDFLREDGSPMPPEECPVSLVLESGEPLEGYPVGVVVPDREETTWLHVNAEPVRNEAGELQEILVTFMDMTERRRIEQSQRYARMLLQRTLDSLNEAVFVLEDKTFKIMDCNLAAQEMFGYRAAEMLGNTTDILHLDEERFEWFRDRMREATEANGSFQLSEYQLRRKDGLVFDTEHYVVPVDSENGERIGWVSVVRDITEHKRAREQLSLRTFELEVLHSLSQKLGYTLDYEDMLRLLIEQMPPVLDFDIAAGLLVRRGQGKSYVIGQHRISERKLHEVQLRMHQALARLSSDETIPDLEEFDSMVCSLPEEDGAVEVLGSEFLVPLFERHGGVAGVLFVGAEREDAFDAEQVGLVFKVAEEASRSIIRLRQLVEEDRQQLETMLHSLSAGVVLLDENDTPVLANPRGERKVEMLGEFSEEGQLLRLGGETLSTLLKRLKEGDTYERMEHPGPPRRIFRVNARELSSGPQTGGHVLTIHDITREQEDAERILNTERRFRTLFDNASDAVFVHNLEGRILDVNQVACDRLEYSREEFLAMTPGDLAPDADEARRVMDRSTRDVRAKGFTFFETVQQRKGGGLVPTEINAKLVRYDDHDNVLSTARNITERKRVEEERREYTAMLDALLAGIEAAFLIVDPDNFVVEEINDRTARLLGLPHDEIVGRAYHEVLDFRQSNDFEEKLCLEECDELLNKETILTLEDDSTVPVNFNRLVLEKGGQTRLAFILFDITQKKSLERRLAYAQKLESVGQLAAGIAHEINTPVQYITGNLDFFRDAFDALHGLITEYGSLHKALEDECDLREARTRVDKATEEAQLDFLLEEIPQALDETRDGLDRVASIVKAMKKFSHPDVEEKKPMDINDAVRNTVEVARNEWKYDSEMVLELDDDLPPLMVVPGDFNQALLNIVVNAAHANSAARGDKADKGTITVSSSLDGNEVEIRVADTGIGIPEGHRNRIFDPFFTTKEVGKGTGQGLAITHSIVEKHGGTIDFESEEGVGTTFIIRLPLNIDNEEGDL